MSHTENTASASVASSLAFWKMLVALVFVSSFLLPIVHWIWQGVGSGMVLLVSLADLVWSSLGTKGTSFVLCALSLGGLCMMRRGRGKYYGASILIGVALFLVISAGLIPNQSRHVKAVVQTTQAVDALSLQEVRTELSNMGPRDTRPVIFNPSLSNYVRWLAWGSYSGTFLKRDCEELQQLAWDNKAFGERYVLFVENQVSTRQSPVKCTATSFNTVAVAYNATYAPNGLVATIEASRAK